MNPEILCLIDFFKASRRAAELAAGVARSRDLKLKLFHVIPPAIVTRYPYPTKVVTVDKQLKKEAEWRLDRIAKRLLPGGVTVEIEVACGHIDREIERVIGRDKPNLVAMGIHGQGALERWFMGSTTERLMRHSPVPLLVAAAAPGQKSPRLKRILVTTDFSDGTAEAIESARKIARGSKAFVTILHVVPDLPDEYTSFVNESKLFRRSEVLMAKLAPLPVEDGCRIDTRIERGVPFRVILSILEDEPVDLLIMNIHGKGLFDRAVIGSTAERVVRAARCPVLLIPPKKQPNSKSEPRKRAA